jgi:hypothetical protein
MAAGSVSPSSLIEDIAMAIDLFTEVAEERQDIRTLGKVCEELCEHYRALGICLLSRDADVDAFFHHLVQAALTRRYYLQGIVVAGGGEPRHRRASFVGPAFDAMAAGQWNLAAEIFRGSADKWTEGDEYEDDFLYAGFVRRVLAGSTDGIDDLLEHWEEVLEGGIDLRLDMARALHARDAQAFSDALRAVIEGDEATARELADPMSGSLRSDEETFFPNRWVSVEGLAMLALAERVGMPIADEMPACPSLVRGADFAPFQSLGYPHVSYVKE